MINMEGNTPHHPRVFIVTIGKGAPSRVPQLYKLRKILSSIFGEMFTIIVSGTTTSFSATPKAATSIPAIFLADFIECLHILSGLTKNVRTGDFIMMFGVASVFQIPIILVARIKRAKVLLFYGGATLSIRSHILLSLVNKIIVESPNVSQFFGIHTRYKKKVVDRGHLFFDAPLFKPWKRYSEREKIVGYVGVLMHVKGVMNLIRAVPIVLQHIHDVNFIVIGEGDLKGRVEGLVKDADLYKYVTMTGWISYRELPPFLNKRKLLVLPSYTEGLPSIIIEAMACGTPVLATPVGGIPDIIKDGETGFIMENNSPECIAENIVRALEHPMLEEIVKNARLLVEREFTYEATLERYRKIVEEL